MKLWRLGGLVAFFVATCNIYTAMFVTSTFYKSFVTEHRLVNDALGKRNDSSLNETLKEGNNNNRLSTNATYQNESPVVLPLDRSLPLHEQILAPWDPILTKGGAARVQEPCRDEIQRYCMDALPVLACLQQQPKDRLSTNCRQTVHPCDNQKGGRPTKYGPCDDSLSYANPLPSNESLQMEQLLIKIDKAAQATNTTYWLVAGSLLGSIIHHGRIPWDDDIDMYVPREQLAALLQEFKAMGLEKPLHYKLVHKIFDKANARHVKGRAYWPSIDLFPVDCNRKGIQQASRYNYSCKRHFSSGTTSVWTIVAALFKPSTCLGIATLWKGLCSKVLCGKLFTSNGKLYSDT